MSFVRPEAAGAIRRWAEPVAAAALVALAGGFGIRWGGALGWIALVAAALALFWLRAAVLGALAARPVTGAGLVVLREGEIGYMGPNRGGFLELDGLVRVEIYLVAPGLTKLTPGPPAPARHRRATGAGPGRPRREA